MNDLERRYRRLLSWYPDGYRREHEEEMLAVLLADAREGQRRPGLLASADLIRGALVMRVRRMGSEAPSRPWSDALALFSLLAPLFLLLVNLAMVAVPYRLSPAIPVPRLWRLLGRLAEIGGPSLLHQVSFDATLASSAIIAALAVLGLRRVTLAALAASTAVWIATQYLIPYPLQALTIGIYLLEAAALLAGPGPRRGRALLSWRHAAVLLPAAAAVEISTLRYEATTGILRILARATPDSGFIGAAVAAVALAGVAAVLGIVLRLGRHLLLLLIAMVWPLVLQVSYPSHSSNDNLIAHPTPAHLALLFLLPALVAGGTLLTAGLRLARSRLSGSGEPGLT